MHCLQKFLFTIITHWTPLRNKFHYGLRHIDNSPALGFVCRVEMHKFFLKGWNY